MAILLCILAAYLSIAAYVYWFILGTSKVGIRVTRQDMLDTARREGMGLVLIALAWFPMAMMLIVRIVQGAIVDRDRDAADDR